MHLALRLWEIYNGIVFSVFRCGAYSGGRIGLLAVQCPGKPDTVHLQRARPWLLAGLHPVSGARLGSPAPFFPSGAASGAAEDPEAALLQEL